MSYVINLSVLLEVSIDKIGIFVPKLFGIY